VSVGKLRAAALAFALAFGCGETLPQAIDAADGGEDGAPDSAPSGGDAAAVDSPADASPSRCDLSTPFMVQPLVIDTAPDAGISASRFGAVLDATESKLFFSFIDGNAMYRLAYATRSPGAAIAFGNAVPLTSQPNDHDAFPWLSPDGQRLYFATTRYGGTWDIYRVLVAPSPGQTVLAGAQSLIASLATENALTLTADEVDLFYSTGAGIRHAERNTEGFYVPDDLASSLSSASPSESRENHPAVSPDGLVIYFASLRDNFSDSSTRIYRATRSKRGEPFSDIEREDSLFGFVTGAPSWVSADLCRLYFFAKASTSATSFTLYVGERQPK
jgi:hypothetical protein